RQENAPVRSKIVRNHRIYLAFGDRDRALSQAAAPMAKEDLCLVLNAEINGFKSVRAFLNSPAATAEPRANSIAMQRTRLKDRSTLPLPEENARNGTFARYG